MNITQKQELRCQYAGLAMHAIIANCTLMDSVIRISDQELMKFEETMAITAVKFADSLIAELDREEKP
ncbi:MAG: hypothetical protein IJ057_06235 [Bacteroidales bacterium]|nr:hypothetical protein [Bacteroidales bacterium]